MAKKKSEPFDKERTADPIFCTNFFLSPVAAHHYEPTKNSKGFFDFISVCLCENSYTKDMKDIKKKDWHLMFITDDMQRKHKHHDLLEETAVYLGDARTAAEFSMYYDVDTKNSYLITLPKSVWKGHVLGEMYLVNPETINLIDCWHSDMRRDKTTVICQGKSPYPDVYEENSFHHVWTYFSDFQSIKDDVISNRVKPIKNWFNQVVAYDAVKGKTSAYNRSYVSFGADNLENLSLVKDKTYQYNRSL